MPIAAKFSKRFYDQIGHDIADELVNWINDVDATYRADLRELNELNYVRFDAKLEQRFAEQDARIEKRFAEQDAKFEKRFAEQDAKFEKRFGDIDKQFGRVDTRFAQLETTFERALKEHTRWMLGAWALLFLSVIGLWTRI